MYLHAYIYIYIFTDACTHYIYIARVPVSYDPPLSFLSMG